MMNYSENQKRRDRKAEINRRFRRMFAVALFMGMIVGFFLGRFAHAVKAVTPESPVEPSTITAVTPESPEPSPDTTPAPEPTTAPVEPVRTPLGTYRVTAYCACEKCCGEWANNRPDGIVYGAAGVELQAGVSCASPLPFGTVVEIEGLGEYTVQDRTATWVVEKYGENLIDIYFDSHEAACDFGLQHLNVYLKEEPANGYL